MNNCRSRAQMELLYMRLTVFNRIVHVWMQRSAAPVIFAFASTIVVALFVSIRFTDLPFIIHTFFTLFSFTGISVLFWLLNEMVRIVRLSEGILADLQSPRAHYLAHLSKMERTNVLKKAKAMRPLVFPIGDCEFTISLPIATWDEILNQTVFLLSL